MVTAVGFQSDCPPGLSTTMNLYEVVARDLCSLSFLVAFLAFGGKSCILNSLLGQGYGLNLSIMFCFVFSFPIC